MDGGLRSQTAPPYLLHALDSRLGQHCWVGGKPSDIIVALYVDAGSGRDLTDSKSTSGPMLSLMGPITLVPLTWVCKRHMAVSRSSSEAEVIVIDAGVRLECIPAFAFWEEVQNSLFRHSGEIALRKRMPSLSRSSL